MSDVLWQQPFFLLALPLPLIAWWLLPRVRSSGARALRVPDLSLVDALAENDPSKPHWSSLVSLLLLVLMWLGLVLAMARPQMLGDPIGTPVSGRDLLLGIDISGSMRERDLYAGGQPAVRMAVVKTVARDFVARRQGDRIGLVMFGSEAYMQTPLTFDHATVQHFLDEAAVGLAGRETAIGDAIGLAVKRLRDRPESSRVLILLTDGENSSGTVTPLEAATVAAQSGVRVYTIGVGANARNSNRFNQVFRSSGLDEATLEAIADRTGGRYFRAQSAAALEDIYREIDRLEPVVIPRDDLRPLRELFVWPLAVALVCSLIWAALGTLRGAPVADART